MAKRMTGAKNQPDPTAAVTNHKGPPSKGGSRIKRVAGPDIPSSSHPPPNHSGHYPEAPVVGFRIITKPRSVGT